MKQLPDPPDEEELRAEIERRKKQQQWKQINQAEDQAFERDVARQLSFPRSQRNDPW